MGALLALALALPTASSQPRSATALIPALEPLAEPMPDPGPWDWLAQHQEPGQSYAEWLAADPVTADGTRRVLSVLPLGAFEPEQRAILELAAEWLEIFFGLPVRMEPDNDLSTLPESARRKHPRSREPQIHAPALLHRVLVPLLPDDALTLIGFTAEDLYPHASWNFVFGQALLRERAAVWSLYRFGDPSLGEEDFRIVLRRTLQLATHETGHNFTMLHCTAHACNMNGSNSLPETDRAPAWLCPQCLAKLVHATGVDPVARFEALLAFCQRHGLEEEASYYRKALAAVSHLDEAQPAGRSRGSLPLQ